MPETAGSGGRRSSEDDAEELRRNTEGDGEGQGKGLIRMGKGGKGKGWRPENKSGDSKSVDAKQRAPFNQKGHEDSRRHGRRLKVDHRQDRRADRRRDQAGRRTLDAIEVQRIPRLRDSAQGYFKNIGGQQTGDPVKK